MNITLTLTAAVTAAALAGCGNEDPGGGEGQGGGRPPTPVEVAAAFTDTVLDAIRATGEIEAVQSIDVRPEITGRLIGILAREGTEVARGTPLFKVDDAELKAEVAWLEAERDLAQQALARTRDLMQQNASSEADLEQAEANARSADARLQLQQVRLERTVVRAPFAGVVGQRYVSMGDYVTTSDRLTTLQTVDPQRAVFRVPERHAERLEMGQEITFRVAAVPDQELSGVVDFIDPIVELPARAITVKAMVRNRNRVLKPGMFIEVRLTTEVRPDAVVVPEDAILPLQGADYVWVIAESLATRREVELGVRTPGFVEILSGVDAGEQVVVGGLERLIEGAPVAPIPVDRTAPEGAG
ncbi:MAG: efflux RND transporter periplasmic adaptor subunit [Gemmatimonadales bacterium]